jgi:hypothetical protein
MSINSPIWQPPEYNEDDFDKVRYRLWLRVRAKLRALKDETLALTLDLLQMEDIDPHIAIDEEKDDEKEYDGNLILIPRIIYPRYLNDDDNQLTFNELDGEDENVIEEDLPHTETVRLFNELPETLKGTTADVLTYDFLEQYIEYLKEEYELVNNPRANDREFLQQEALALSGKQLKALHEQICTGTLK